MVCVLVLLVRLCVVESVWTPRQIHRIVVDVGMYVRVGKSVQPGLVCRLVVQR